jgi:hypothetical protein
VEVYAQKREELYRGTDAEGACDIVLILAEYHMGGANERPPLITTMDPSLYSKVNGEHRKQGALLARGPMIRKDVWVRSPGLADVAPTILYALAVPAREKMDGVVLEDLFLPLYRLGTHCTQLRSRQSEGHGRCRFGPHARRRGTDPTSPGAPGLLVLGRMRSCGANRVVEGAQGTVR